MKNFRRIVVFRALQLGDMLCAVPALRALRAGCPDAKITLIGLPWARTFVERYSNYLDDFLEFPGYPGLPERVPDIARIPEFLFKAQQEHFDLSIQLHGSGSYVNSLLVMLGARHHAGFYTPHDYCPDPERFLRYPEHEPEVVRFLRLMEFLGLPLQGDDIDFPVHQADIDELMKAPELSRLQPGSFICIHPGARWPSRRWSAEGFAAVGDRLSRQGLQVVLTGSAEERDLTGAVSAQMREPNINAAGKTSLGALAVLLQRAKLLVCNDTGISHMAAALKVPSVVLCLGSDPERWAPLDRQRHRVVSTPIDCRPCDHRICPIGHPCSLNLPPEKVIQEILCAV
jgi:ADP-heptose:LPS heptosyltransferase